MNVGKKGQAEVIIEWLFAGIFTIVLCVFLVIIVSAFTLKEINTVDLEAQTFMFKLYYDQEIFSPNSITSFGVIDKEKFNVEHFEKSNKYVEDRIAARLRLVDSQTSWEKSFTHNQEMFTARYPLAAEQVSGAGSAVLKEFFFPVRIYDQGIITQGHLFVEAVIVE